MKTSFTIPTNKPLWALYDASQRGFTFFHFALFPTKKYAQEAKKIMQEASDKSDLIGPFKIYTQEALDHYIQRNKLYRNLTPEQELKALKKVAKKVTRSKKAARDFLKQIRIPKSAFQGD